MKVPFMRFNTLAAVAVSLASLIAVPALASETPVLNEPATIGAGVGYFDLFNHNDQHKAAADFRLEYRSAFDMLGLAKAHNSVIAIRPFGGIETSSDGMLYGLGGFVFDVPVGKHFVLSPNIGVGLFYNGDGKRLGSFVEFRSTMELGYKFDGGTRVTTAFGHISNAGLTDRNPGSEILTLYVHVPVDKVFSK
ncbi:MAG: acyloxyacyl hydrolase [Alphaproteobacteria bacterium]|nr:acyloxyacyl hydrolase [Alphaproteobacteria bacterium]